ncbi:UDP-N-acetylglucosamine 2-epimerase [Kitasatospora sp. LaBMicrA B282]|uniref:UDP-N-acetylglucosamine 2-epimerase n=1 Tax=Kitasatospora sp. LaBMicrA B282 TaxID=3420949 RepID=UPI003D10A84B
MAFLAAGRSEAVRLAPVARRFPLVARVLCPGRLEQALVPGEVFVACGLRGPDALFKTDGRTSAARIAQAARSLDALFARQRPAVLVVHGSSDAALGAALAAQSRSIALVRVDAGVRTFEHPAREERNRVLTDRMADLLCASTASNAANLTAEGIAPRRIALTGSTVLEAVGQHLPPARQRAHLLTRHGVSPDRFVLGAIEGTAASEDAAALRAVLAELDRLAEGGWPVLLPAGRRLRATAERAGCARLLSRLRIVERPDYGTFLALAREAALVIADTGETEEDITVLGRPLVALGRRTGRPESLVDFTVLVAPGPDLGHHARRLLAEAKAIRARLQQQPSPFGGLDAGRHIADATRRLLADRAA